MQRCKLFQLRFRFYATAFIADNNHVLFVLFHSPKRRAFPERTFEVTY